MSPRVVSVSLVDGGVEPGLLEAAVADFAGVAREAVSIRPLCHHCGGAHGKPRVVEPRTASGGEYFVSKSRAAGTVAVGVTDAGPLGIDIESLEQMSRARVDEVAFAPAERALIEAAAGTERDRIRTRLWSRKEAYLKATGEGLRRDLVTVDVTSTELGAVFAEIATGDDSLVGYVAVLGDVEPTVSIRLAAH